MERVRESEWEKESDGFLGLETALATLYFWRNVSHWLANEKEAGLVKKREYVQAIFILAMFVCCVPTRMPVLLLAETKMENDVWIELKWAEREKRGKENVKVFEKFHNMETKIRKKKVLMA